MRNRTLKRQGSPETVGNINSMTIQSPTSNMGAAERSDYNRSLSPQTMAAIAENRKRNLDL